MYITPDYRRRIHIMGKPDNTVGYMLKVYDAETSEQITNITRIVITTDANGVNEAEVTYIEHDEQNKIVVKDGDVISHTVTLDGPSFNLTAFETIQQTEDIAEGAIDE